MALAHAHMRVRNHGRGISISHLPAEEHPTCALSVEAPARFVAGGFFIQVAEGIGSKFDTVSNLPPTVLYALAVLMPLPCDLLFTGGICLWPVPDGSKRKKAASGQIWRLTAHSTAHPKWGAASVSDGGGAGAGKRSAGR